MQIFEIHYYLETDIHELDAFTRNKCELYFLEIVEAVYTQFNIEIDLQAIPSQEGGFRDFWKAIPKHKEQIEVIGIILGLILPLLTCVPQSYNDNKKQELEIEYQKIKNKREEIALEKDKIELEQFIIRKKLEQENFYKQNAENINQLYENSLINSKKSKIYKEISGDQKIERVGFAILDHENGIQTKEIIVERQFFKNFIIVNKNEDILYDPNAVIKVVAPVLSDSKTKWKGEYDGKSISLNMIDDKFKNKVFKKQIAFKNGGYIHCELEIKNKLDDSGNVISTVYSVTHVNEYIEDKEKVATLIETPKKVTKQGELF